MRTFKLAGLAVLASAMVAPVAASAQEAEDEVLEEIITTGSRLRANPNLAAATPVLSVTGSEGMERGNVRIEDFVNTLPQVFAGQASEISNGASGTATLNLRGLGSQRTLVLIDGRRLPYGSSSSSSANLDVIPLQLVERVDILTGGASAVYGSDAVGGVANFILKRDFEGVEMGYQWGESTASNSNGFWRQVLEASDNNVPGSRTDGKETLIYTIMGGNLDRGGNVTVFASYEDREAILQADRISSGCALGQGTGAGSFGGYACVGSGNFRTFGGPGGFYHQEESGNIVDYLGNSAHTYNFGPSNFFQRPSERYTLYGKASVDINDTLEAFADISYTNNFSDAQIAETASFGRHPINCNNPFINVPQNDGAGGLITLSTDVFGCTDTSPTSTEFYDRAFASHRNVEGGPRNSRNENTAFRIVAGLRGSFAEDIWAWEAFAQVSETRDQGESTNDFVIANLHDAFNAVDDGAGNVVCASGNQGCVPYNIFQRGPAGESMVTEAMTDYIHGIGLTNGSTSQTVYGGSLQADLGEYGIQIPSADYGISFLVGFEQRKDTLSSRPDEISQVPGGGFTGVGGATLPVAGQVEVDELFTEVEIPILSGMTGFQELTVRGQYRFSDYQRDGNDTSTSVDTDTYGMSLSWAPIDSLRFRAQYQRAVRAPNVIALFAGQNTNLPDLSPAGVNSQGVQLFDPCSSAFPIASAAACANTGVTAAQYGTIFDVLAGQTQSITGGNPFLDPEIADTVTYGLVWTPSFAQGLSVSLDYFTILVEDAISAGIPAQTTLDQCLATGNPSFCGLITRDQDGSLAAGEPGTGFLSTNVNIAELETTGIDLQVLYSFDVGSHGFNIDYASTILDQADFVPYPGADPVECEGFFGNECGSPSPEYRHRMMATWQTPWSIDATLTWRHFGSVDNDNTAELLETSLDSVDYIDLSGRWYLMDDSVMIALSVLNVTGEEPPVFSGAGPASFGNGNTYPTVYDTSTAYFASLKLNF